MHLLDTTVQKTKHFLALWRATGPFTEGALNTLLFKAVGGTLVYFDGSGTTDRVEDDLCALITIMS